MYEQHFGFTETPFSLSPDPKFLYRSEAHANAFELLQYALERREGFAVVTGDIGTGKTTLCRALVDRLDPRTCVSLILNPFLSEEDLLMCILRDFGVLSREFRPWSRVPTRQDLIDVLHQFLLSLVPLQARAVVIVDEAQNLPLRVLEQMRLLSNLETNKQKLLQIVLLGQRNLTPLLQSPELRQLEQRISIRCELQPLGNVSEVNSYIAHRLAVAAGRRTPVFGRDALALVHRYSEGVPRVINLLCDRALTAAYASARDAVEADLVHAAAQDLRLRVLRQGAESRNWFDRACQVLMRRELASAGVS